ncbi:hypothetical protein HHL21_20760 [Massilia sp. RP-1-19]|uniref:Uncharacterized protein n=1 Tax=Massilia polaris TaxID=2728846 RepID=A0A848HVZ3_9BURK|nr:hypothetical protein [Massilia polaris]NML63473.1 hypothetical protein [Massilia polaris]
MKVVTVIISVEPLNERPLVRLTGRPVIRPAAHDLIQPGQRVESQMAFRAIEAQPIPTCMLGLGKNSRRVCERVVVVSGMRCRE